MAQSSFSRGKCNVNTCKQVGLSSTLLTRICQRRYRTAIWAVRGLNLMANLAALSLFEALAKLVLRFAVIIQVVNRRHCTH